ncbi:DNRLRE domain-containing protein [Aneurinibacillus tyrosinisolvens]|uniref:DNRLRE domain-containing protein n=1 Tax=Aneurinibacillus tyrosinisolvens TaxID=1443435 RepID=UPI00063F83D9|nr:DNRLRE domain-containing protein [Aneurinibacillus tyrosinisolvens]
MSFLYKRKFSIYRKVISWILVITLGGGLLPSQFSSSASADNQGGTAINNLDKKERKEVTDLRTEKSKTYVNPDGTWTTEITQQPTSYKNSSGKWESIDSTLLPDETESSYVNKTNDFRVSFPKKSKSGNAIEVNKAGDSVSFAPVSQEDAVQADVMNQQNAVTATTDKNNIIYSNLYPGVDFHYAVGQDKVKEEIVLKQRPDTSTPTHFSFKVNLKGLTFEQQPDGQLLFKDKKTGEIKFYLEKPFMYDSNVPAGFEKLPGTDAIPEGSQSYDVQMKTVQNGNQLFIDVIPNREWLQNPARVYPVVIDPTVREFQPGVTPGLTKYDANIRSSVPTQTGGADKDLGVGTYTSSAGSNTIRGLVKFDLSSIPRGSRILDANMNLWLSSIWNTTGINVSAYEITKDWKDTTVNWNTFNGTTAWATPGGDVKTTPAATVSGISVLTDLGVHYAFDLTKAATGWNDSPSSNYGVLLKSDSESTATLKKFVSSDDTTNSNYAPMLAVTYYPGSRLGLESYWTYDTHALTGGQSSINLTTGNNVVQFTDLADEGRGGMGINFTRTYNSKAVNDSPIGYGWTFTGGETVVESVSNGQQALYTDADGTAHLFTYNKTTGQYDAPAGTYLKLKRIYDNYASVIGYEVTYKDGMKLHFDVYDPNGMHDNTILSRIGYAEDRHGNRVTYGYDSTGNLVTIADPSGRKATLTYNASNKISSITDFAGRQTVYTYNGSDLQYVDNYVDATNFRRTQFVYQGEHMLTDVIDSNLRKTTFIPDGKSVVKVQEPDVQAATDASTRPGTTYTYEPATSSAKTTDRNGNTTTYLYNTNYVVTSVTDALGNTTNVTSMDGNYKPLQVTDPKGNVTTNTFDSNGNKINTTDPLGHQISFTYGSYDDVTSSTDALGKKTTYTYNAAGDLLSVTNPLNQTTSYTYDAYGNRLTTQDANGNITTYMYDANGVNVSSIKDAAGRVTSISYDLADNTTKIVEPNGHVTDQTFNKMDEVTNMDEKLSDNSQTKEINLTTSYDNNGNVKQIKDENSSRTADYAYTGTNDIESQTGGLSTSLPISYGYDPNQNLTEWNLNSGARQFKFRYNAANQLVQTLDAANTLIESYLYDKNGNPTSVQRSTVADGILQTENYDSSNRLTSVIHNKGANTPTLSSFTYTHDLNGRILDITDQAGVKTSYTYDDAGRLLSESDPTGKTTYTYDSVGNRMSKTSGTATTNYQYNNLNQLVNRTGADGAAAYQYNEKGELTAKGNTKFDWNTDGKVVKIINPDGSTVEFTYDAQGRRVQKIVKNAAGTVTKQLKYEYEDATGNLLTETDVLANTTISYNYNAAGDLMSQTQGGKTYYYNYDGQGNVVSLTDSTGTVVVSYSYDAWGQKVNKTGTLYNPITSRGYYYDEESKLYYLFNRYYDAEDGRFLSKDTIEPINQNLYVYAENDPINKVDPDGNYAAFLYFIPGLGEVAMAATIVGAGIYTGYKLAHYFAKKSEHDPYARPNQKKQGRERKEKKKSGKWKQNPNKRPAPLKKHTPGREHRKY